MQYTKIEGLDKPISKIVLGTPALPTENLKDCYRILDDMYDLGVNTYDAAHVYGNDGEAVVFKWAKERGLRDKIVLLSKCAHPNHLRNRLTPFDVMSDVSDTLAKADGDYLDIYMFHRDDPSVAVGPVIETMNRLIEQKKIRTFGASNWTYERVKEANDYAEEHGLIPLTSVSPNFGLAEQIGDPWGEGCVSISGPKKKKARDFYEKQQIPIFSYSPLARGLFSGRVKSRDLEGAKRILDEPAIKGYLYDSNIERLRRIEIIADELGISVPQLALAWVFNQPLNVLAIAGVKSTDHMKVNIEAMNVKLSRTQLDWLDLKTK